MTPKSFDICIIGGGPAGLACAAALDKKFTIALIEQNAVAPQLAAAFDGRTIALAHQGAELLRQAGVWPALRANAQPITHIRTADRHSLLKLDFYAGELREETGGQPFGYMIENRHLRAALWRRVQALRNVTVFQSTAVTALGIAGPLATVAINRRPRTLGAALVVAADGRTSPSRAAQDINTFGFAYNQHALICTVEHTNPHNGTALEHFVAEGPLATLPLTGNRSGIVWTARPETVAALMALDDASFLALLARNGAAWLGEMKLHTPRAAYPLHLQHAHTYTAAHFALVGDAAHVMHPIAGQGFNMGLRDVACLARLVAAARTRGLRADDASVLAAYEQQRRADNQRMLAATDMLDRLFIGNPPLLGTARRLGLAAVNHIGPLRRFFMRQAMGVGRKH